MINAVFHIINSSEISNTNSLQTDQNNFYLIITKCEILRLHRILH